MSIRPQYHFRNSDQGLCAWDVRNLARLAKDRPVIDVALTRFAELDELYWYGGESDRPTPRSLVNHFRLISEADLRWPVIIDPNGRLMDGMHRLCKALMEGRTSVSAQQLREMPATDYIGIAPENLPYD